MNIVTYGPGGYDPAKPNNNVVRTEVVPDNPATVNADTLRARAAAALIANSDFRATVAARRTAIANGKATAQTGLGATVGSLANAQTQVRSLWTVLVQVATALNDLNDQAELLTKESNELIHMALGLLDDITDTA